MFLYAGICPASYKMEPFIHRGFKISDPDEEALEGINDSDFNEQLETLTTTYLENLSGLFVRKRKSFKETLQAVHEDIPALAIRTKTYVPNT